MDDIEEVVETLSSQFHVLSKDEITNVVRCSSGLERLSILITRAEDRQTDLRTENLLRAFKGINEIIARAVAELFLDEKWPAAEILGALSQTNEIKKIIYKPQVNERELKTIVDILVLHRLFPSFGLPLDFAEHLRVLSSSSDLDEAIETVSERVEVHSVPVQDALERRSINAPEPTEGRLSDPVLSELSDLQMRTRRRKTVFGQPGLSDLEGLVQARGMDRNDVIVWREVTGPEPTFFAHIFDESTDERMLHARLHYRVGENDWAIGSCVTRGNFIFVFPNSDLDAICTKTIYLKDAIVRDFHVAGELLLLVVPISPPEAEFSSKKQRVMLSFSSLSQLECWKSHILHVVRGFGHPIRQNVGPAYRSDIALPTFHQEEWSSDVVPAYPPRRFSLSPGSSKSFSFRKRALFSLRVPSPYPVSSPRDPMSVISSPGAQRSASSIVSEKHLELKWPDEHSGDLERETQATQWGSLGR